MSIFDFSKVEFLIKIVELELRIPVSYYDDWSGRQIDNITTFSIKKYYYTNGKNAYSIYSHNGLPDTKTWYEDKDNDADSDFADISDTPLGQEIINNIQHLF
jgi:hypothetical protein